MPKWIERFFKKPTHVQDFATMKDPTVKILGDAARSLLENVAFNEAVSRIEKEYFHMWRMSKPLDYEGREAIWRGLQSISEIRLKLTGMVNEMLIDEHKKINGGS